jgi:hypothetical protein
MSKKINLSLSVKFLPRHLTWYFDTAVFFNKIIALLMTEDYNIGGSCSMHGGDYKCILNFL